MIVDRIAHDFILEDRWTFDLGDRKAKTIEEFLPAFWSVLGNLEKSTLSKIRLRVGEALGWDDHDFTLPIPGCTEKSVSERLTEEDKKENRAGDRASPLPTPAIKTVYVTEREALYEVSNDTIHALLHVSIASDEEAVLRVYVKHRGVSSRIYMAAIWPARHFILYPAMIKKINRAWCTREVITA